jgi:hypothetical protein
VRQLPLVTGAAGGRRNGFQDDGLVGRSMPVFKPRKPPA